MTLDEFLKHRGLSEGAFGNQIGVSQQAVNRYRQGKRVPGRDVMTKIIGVTDGLVTANDFYGASQSGEAA